MNSQAKILRKYIIRANMRVLTPIRVASGQEDGVTDILILKNKNNEAVIPGTSLAGVLRNMINGLYGIMVEEQLFGRIYQNPKDVGEQSMLNISDIILSESKIINRDGVAIDTYRGVGMTGAKYDFEMLDSGPEGWLNIEITVRQADLAKSFVESTLKHGTYAQGDIYADLAATIADLLTRGFNVGSLTSKGFGRIASSKPVAVFCFDFEQPNAFAEWLLYLRKGDLPATAYTADPMLIDVEDTSTLHIEASFALKSSLLIRDYDAAQKQNDENEKLKLASIQMMSDGKYIIPGSSIKGVLRNRAKKIIMLLNGGSSSQADKFINALMGFADEKAAAKSRLTVAEVCIDEAELTKHKHSRNRIDRFTGGTVEGALFTEEPVWQITKENAPIHLNFSILNCSDAEVGLALLLLKDLWLGNLSVGGGKAVGRGTLSGRSCKISFKGNSYTINQQGGFAVDGDKLTLESYVAALLAEMKE